MDPVLFWTAVAAVSALVVPLVGYVVHRIRQGDLDQLSSLKADADNKTRYVEHRVDALDRRIADVVHDVQAKLDKAEHQIAIERVDKELESVRRDSKEAVTRNEGKLDKLSDMLLEFFKGRH